MNIQAIKAQKMNRHRTNTQLTNNVANFLVYSDPCYLDLGEGGMWQSTGHTTI